MTDLGNIALFLALGLSFYSALAAILGTRWSRPELVDSARNGVYAVAALVSISIFFLLYALVTRDFQVEYVASTTSRALPLLYTISALWGGQEGSLLFWAWLLAVMSGIAVFQNRDRNQELMPYVMAVLMAITFFFLLVMASVANPFYRLDFVPADGLGMNPLLQNHWMLSHPVALYLGFVGFSIPFAFAAAALLSGRLRDTWIRSTRRWTLFSWLLLSLGIGMGAQWAYSELGWGGYWGWDPVENASFLPWLTSTAFLHSVMIQERRGMLKVWNLILIGLTFLLAVFGTFLTRSGILQSVHAFALGKVGPFFFAFLGITILVFIFLIFKRRNLLKSEHQLESLVSRESSFLLNNLLFMGVTFAIFWGTIFPLLSEAITGEKITVGPPFFNQVTGPQFLALVVLAGIGPLLAWRRTSHEKLVRNFFPAITMAILYALLLYLFGVRDLLAIFGFAAAVFLAASIISEFWWGVLARREMTGEGWVRALVSLISRNRRRYGGYIVHLGIVLIAVGITGSTFFKTEAEAHLAPGELVTVKDYTLHFAGLYDYSTPSHYVLAGAMVVSQGDKMLGIMSPEKNFHPGDWPSTTEAAIRSTPKEDLYLVLAGWEEDGSATFKITINPMMMWLWTGWGVLILGTLVAAWPEVGKEAVRAAEYAPEPVPQKV
ncbi:MAG: heme lyase CcmF/NrfE family subunit [Chloroflexi bacterium]|nr:heme lyase CcmF/NrfE family subunit [Chloroflexota bacterium]